MKKPKSRSSEIDQDRFAGWIDRFRFYRHPPNVQAVNTWLDRFSSSDRDFAARILDGIEVVPEVDIQKNYKTCAAAIPSWKQSSRQNAGRTFVVGYGKAGESGEAMVRTFREANRLAGKKHYGLFCSASELPEKKLTAFDTVVFVDDFSGSGTQLIEIWPLLEELIASEAKCFLILTAITATAKRRVSKELKRLKIVAGRVIKDRENIFSDLCLHFSSEEKRKILGYCKIADKKNPKGFGECGLLYVLSHKTPNNSIPILHANNAKWIGLFPRYLNP